MGRRVSGRKQKGSLGLILTTLHSELLSSKVCAFLGLSLAAGLQGASCSCLPGIYLFLGYRVQDEAVEDSGSALAIWTVESCPTNKSDAPGVHRSRRDSSPELNALIHQRNGVTVTLKKHLKA
uniref:Putative secreted protein n=1 Tax=Amblyomma americanum TaxID=6943 RepID=A0A0C9SDD7_AMBAM